MKVFEQKSDLICEREQCVVWTGEGKHWELRNLLGGSCRIQRWGAEHLDMGPGFRRRKEGEKGLEEKQARDWIFRQTAEGTGKFGTPVFLVPPTERNRSHEFLVLVSVERHGWVTVKWDSGSLPGGGGQGGRAGFVCDLPQQPPQQW